ncbi:nitroreductase family protein [uncultured Clostridium sp.]|uniref:nitroreductase family protein n=1 Tax=uncultured Clostridium sp. TaxID=59620 RepID=UPI00261D8001|nr:nitroreductase family protein [uncultured Clostridium sp.]
MNTLDAIIKRKGVRNFTDEQLSKDKLKTLIHAANTAAISGGGRPDSDSARQITVVQNLDVLNSINATIEKSIGLPNALYNAKTLIIVSAPKNQYGAEQLDCALAVQNIALAATDMSLNSIIMTAPLYAINMNEDLKNNLNLPEGFTPYLCICVGYTNDTSIKTREYIDTNVNYI